MSTKKYKCRLCEEYFEYKDMSEEHFPARSVGNDDIIALDLTKTFDFIFDEENRKQFLSKMNNEDNVEKILSNVFDNDLSKSLYPSGRTARTLCRKCNTFLGKYDEAYLKFFTVDGKSEKTKGFSKKTKIEVIKSIFGKFLSIPETQNEKFDFLDFLKDDSLYEYSGKWQLYFIKRDFSTDFLGLKDIGTGKAEFDNGIVYEFSDEKFIFNLMNFEKHSCYPMTNIFDINKKIYSIIEGTGELGGYHAQILLPRLLKF